MSEFEDLPDLAAERLGGTVPCANDEFFAEKENLLREAPAVWVADRYTDRGKWMDGWETRRRRTPGHDWAVIRLGMPGILRGAIVDTAHFKGNFPAACSLEACGLEREATAEELAGESIPWTEILSRRDLLGDAANRFAIECERRFTHVRLNIFPDGGVARLRLFGEPLPRWPELPPRLDLAALPHGGRVVAVSDRFFGPPHKLGLPDAPRGMHDGWETRRRRGPGNDWVILRLATEGTVDAIEIDTSFFKGNAPGTCALEGCVSTDIVPAASARWITLLAPTPVHPDTRHRISALASHGPFTHVRLSTFPDGGVARLRIWGAPSTAGRVAAHLRWLNALPPAAAERELASCCASRAWACSLAAGRPFASFEELARAAEVAAAQLATADWLEAFAAHPRLGERPAGDDRHARWSKSEQSGTEDADTATLERLRAANRAYESRFGFVFLLRAAGRNAQEMLRICEQRLRNDPEQEVSVAAREQREITHLRLRRLLGQA